jgi:hypothetical protein
MLIKRTDFFNNKMSHKHDVTANNVACSLHFQIPPIIQMTPEEKKLHDFIRRILNFIYMEMPAHETTKKFVHEYFNEIQGKS